MDRIICISGSAFCCIIRKRKFRDIEDEVKFNFVSGFDGGVANRNSMSVCIKYEVTQGDECFLAKPFMFLNVEGLLFLVVVVVVVVVGGMRGGWGWDCSRKPRTIPRFYICISFIDVKRLLPPFPYPQTSSSYRRFQQPNNIPRSTFRRLIFTTFLRSSFHDDILYTVHRYLFKPPKIER